MITVISVKRSMQQISRLYAARVIIGVVVLISLYFDANDDINPLNGVPTFLVPKMFFNEPDDVPISRPLSSSSFNVFISL